MQGKRILLGICGGIAAYRVAELLRLLKAEGAMVRCVMTKSACQFITPLTLESLSAEPVYTDLFDLTAEREMGHIRLARWADVLCIVPATANSLAKFRYGMADDLLSTLVLARRGAICFAPSMNTAMWEAAATVENIRVLQQRSWQLIAPEHGTLACGEFGAGRLASMAELLYGIKAALKEKSLQGQRWVLNAGCTREYWDAVRFLGNAASGRLGLALAEQLAARGAEVCLIAGPEVAASVVAVQRVDVVSAADMYDACLAYSTDADVFIGTAAVSDFRFAQAVQGKHKRAGHERIMLELVNNPDVIAAVAGQELRPKRVIGFAAEARDHVSCGQKKLQSKGLDALFVNDLSAIAAAASGGWWLQKEQQAEAVEARDKDLLAALLIDRIVALQ